MDVRASGSLEDSLLPVSSLCVGLVSSLWLAVQASSRVRMDDDVWKHPPYYSSRLCIERYKACLNVWLCRCLYVYVYHICPDSQGPRDRFIAAVRRRESSALCLYRPHASGLPSLSLCSICLSMSTYVRECFFIDERVVLFFSSSTTFISFVILFLFLFFFFFFFSSRFLRQYFDPGEPEEGYSLAISSGCAGARLTHSHR